MVEYGGSQIPHINNLLTFFNQHKQFYIIYFMSTTSLTIPTNYTISDKRSSRPIIPIQMQKPDGSWSDPIKFNFDTGASSPTDVPLDLLKAFGGQVSTSNRKAVPWQNQDTRVQQ